MKSFETTAPHASREPGARALLPLVCAALLTVALSGGSSLAKEIPTEGDPLPLESEGDLHFFVDLAGYQGVEGDTDQEIYISVSNDQLAYGEEDQLLQGKLKFEFWIRSPEGAELGSWESTFEPQAPNEFQAHDRGIVQIVRQRAMLPPGVYHLEVALTDERSKKSGLFNRIRRKRREGRAVGWIRVGAFPGDELAVSDLALIRSFRSAEGREAGRNGVDFDPNPNRLYGLPLALVRTYFEVYGGREHEPEDSYLVQLQVLDKTELPIESKMLRTRPTGSSFVITEAFPLTPEVVAGTYFLDVTVMNERSRKKVRGRRPFEVIWSVTSWAKEEEALLQEMRLIMKDSEFKTLESLSAGAREIYLAEYWHGLDSDPNTHQNETYIEFQRRIAEADRKFAATLQRGILTDRGRVWVRYGPPDDIRFEPSSAGFSIDPEDLVSTPAERVDLGNRPGGALLNPDEIRQGDISGVAEQRGGPNVKAKDVEIWDYDGFGKVLTGYEDRDDRSHRGLRFIFADEMGDGNFELIGSRGTSVY